jgi:threonine/homoserine/homoserine lactone efflux protein
MAVECHVLVPFVVAVVVIQVTPGPGMLFILANGISGGRRAGVAAALGAAAGMVVQTVAPAAGLAALLRAAPLIFDLVRIAGGAYLICVAIRLLRGPTLSRERADKPRPARSVFVRAVINNLANPKVVIFFVAFLPQFVVQGGAPPRIQFFLLGMVFLLVGLVLDVGIGLFAGKIGEALRTRAWLSRLLDRVAGATLAALGMRLALERGQ